MAHVERRRHTLRDGNRVVVWRSKPRAQGMRARSSRSSSDRDYAVSAVESIALTATQVLRQPVDDGSSCSRLNK
jgi:hypothetical protein